MNVKSVATALVATFVVAAVALLGWQLVQKRDAQICSACQRPVHEHSRTVAKVGGKRGVYCCPACAWSERIQASDKVEILELTDHRTSLPLAPSSAVFVRDSDVNPCMEQHAKVSADKQPMHVHYDRCAPSLLAFATQAEAQAFTRQHGGRLLTLAEAAARFDREAIDRAR